MDKHITICASGPELSVKMGLVMSWGQRLLCNRKTLYGVSQQKPTGRGFTFKGVVREASENMSQQNTFMQRKQIHDYVS